MISAWEEGKKYTWFLKEKTTLRWKGGFYWIEVNYLSMLMFSAWAF